MLILLVSVVLYYLNCFQEFEFDSGTARNTTTAVTPINAIFHKKFKKEEICVCNTAANNNYTLLRDLF